MHYVTVMHTYKNLTQQHPPSALKDSHRESVLNQNSRCIKQKSARCSKGCKSPLQSVFWGTKRSPKGPSQNEKPGTNTPPQNCPHLMEEVMPGIQRCFFSTLDYLQQTHPHVLEQIWTPLCVTHVPAQPRQRHHTATCTYTDTSTHRSPGKARANARCPNPQPRPHYSQDPASYARPHSPGPSAVPGSPPLRLRLHNLHHHNHLICHHQHVLVQHSSTQAARETSLTGPRTRPHSRNPAAAKAHAPTKPAPAARQKPKTAAKQPPGPVGAP